MNKCPLQTRGLQMCVSSVYTTRHMRIKDSEMALMPRMTGAAAQHVVLMRVAFAQDAYEVFGWAAASVFTYAEMRARTAAFIQDMRYVPSLAVWRMVTPAERQAARAVHMAAYMRFRWAMPIVADREQVMHDQSDEETDAEA
jgi:hypothetical protein